MCYEAEWGHANHAYIPGKMLGKSGFSVLHSLAKKIFPHPPSPPSAMPNLISKVRSLTGT